MNLILKHNPLWFGSLSTPDGSSTLVLLGDNGQQVTVPAVLLLAASPLVRSILRDLLPPAYSPCFLSLPAATGDTLEMVKDILTTGTVACDLGGKIDEVRQVFWMLGVEAFLVSSQVESIQYGQILDRDIKAEVSHEGVAGSSLEEGKVQMENIVNIEDQERTDEESNTYGKSICSTNFKEEEEKIEMDFIVKTEDQENTDQESNTYGKSICSTKIKVHCCNLCPQKFSVKSKLVRHVKTVHDKFRIQCNLCSKKFTQNNQLVVHIKSFHEQIKIPCNLCPMKFNVKQSLVRHINSVHDQIRFHCNLCSQTFSEKRKVVRHVKTVHEKIKIQCNLCPKKFSQKRHLVAHIKSFHDQIKIQCNF
jgi:hypothetical protein